SDAGSAFYVVSQAIRLKQNQRYITSGAIATMGFTLPAAIGTSVANNKGTVLAVTGDGSFQQNIQELQVMYHHNLPIKLFVMNNGGYFSIRKTESRYFDGRFVGESEESGLSFPETSAIAGAYKIPYLKVSTVEDCEKSLAKFVQMPGPGIVEVMLNKDIEIIPTNASLMRADGIMVSKPLEDMYPFLPREEFAENMIIRPISE
ncbi:MAG: thiamine pyrophosphate-dependent enzyme, partial [Oscillospiraceae bacterium]